MTFPKGYVPPNKKTTDEKAKQLADEKAKQLADEKTVSKGNDAELSTAEDLHKRSSTQQNDIADNNINYQNNDIDYTLIWDEMNKACVQTVKEATN
ncbi:MAG TPA: hypothetical protein VEX17_00110, partial [Bacillales bacterium]|nr:hypothetical protein [Bacillales bacterium]